MTSAPSLLRRLDDSHVPMVAARLVLAYVLIRYGLVKIVEPVEFLKQIREYHLFPESRPYFMNITAVVLPWVELICGVLLVLGVWFRGVGITFLLMLMAFTPAILARAVGVYNSGDIPFCEIAFDCGCGVGLINTCEKLSQNIGLAVLCVVVIFSKSRLCAVERLLTRTPAG